MNKKDPAFLMYSKDWLEGTAEMFPQEKGIYIDLLCHQHQKGSIPCEPERIARMVGLPQLEFDKIWQKLKHKFHQEDDRMVNRTLQRIMSERLSKGNTNRIIGTFASVIRKREMSKSIYQAIRSQFKIEEFSGISTERLTERLTEWLDVRLKSFAIGDANAIGDINTEKESVRGKTFKAPELAEVIEFFKEKGFNENYAKRAFDHYNLAEWKDTNGKQVKNWKQKMNTNWLGEDKKTNVTAIIIPKGQETPDPKHYYSYSDYQNACAVRNISPKTIEDTIFASK